MEVYKTNIDAVLSEANKLSKEEMSELKRRLLELANGKNMITELFKSPVNNLFLTIKNRLARNELNQLINLLPEETQQEGTTSGNQEAKNIGEKIKKEEIDKRIVITGTHGGFTSFDTTNSKNKGAGATYDVRPVNDPGRYHFYHNYEEVSKKWNKDNEPFTFIYSRDGKKYLYATAGLNAFSGKSEGGRYGNVFVSIELTEDLPSWAEEYILKKAIDLANKEFGKDFKTPIEFKEEYLSKLII